MIFKIQKTEAEWKSLLKDKGAEPLAYHVMRNEGTERAFTGRFESNKLLGTYFCICCDKPLFDSSTKYESGSGWPSFYKPLNSESVAASIDLKMSISRTEIHCPDCGAHLGHVFDDGPDPTGLRYCMNSASLQFKPS